MHSKVYRLHGPRLHMEGQMKIPPAIIPILHDMGMLSCHRRALIAAFDQIDHPDVGEMPTKLGDVTAWWVKLQYCQLDGANMTTDEFGLAAGVSRTRMYALAKSLGIKFKVGHHGRPLKPRS